MRVFWDEVQLQHTPRFFLQRGQVRPNFEVPDRARALLEGVAALGLATEKPQDAPVSALETVHDAAYVEFLRTAHAEWAALPEAGPEVVANVHPSPEMLANGARRDTSLVGRAGWFMADTACPIGAGTWAAALAAARCALAAADEAAAGRSAYALVRPPGHHAYPARAGGHCYINNAALAAERLRSAGAARVAVLDIDSHHGNGTQGAFWERDDVLFISVHGDPAGYYPWYVGHADERGGGDGVGCNLNLPLPRGAGDEAWLEALDAALAEIRHFGADALVVSLGFDASEHEPLNFLAVTADGFAKAGERIGALRLPAAIVQEGGYNTDMLGRLLQRFLTAYGA
ncbi:MAG TPA: histone deacetylase family protein [Acetobacteraceae bacterium]|nr:histone deacetylase family protein [Acetobacteraceae bacterium]